MEIGEKRSEQIVKLIGTDLAREVYKKIKVEPGSSYKGRPFALDPWQLCCNAGLARKVIQTIHQKWSEDGKIYDTIVAASYWGIPLAVLLASQVKPKCDVLCLDDEVLRYPEKFQGEGRKAVFLVDDTIKTGGSLVWALEKLEEFNLSASQFLAILDNNAYPNREALESLRGRIEIFALTRAKL